MDSPRKRLSAIVRRIKPNDERQPCLVCGRYRSITQAHHLFDVSHVVDLLLEHKTWWVGFPMRFVWLCPTHHVIWHAIENSKTDTRRIELLEDMTVDERAGMTRLLEFEQMHINEVTESIWEYKRQNP